MLEKKVVYYCVLFEQELNNALNVGIFCRHCDLEDFGDDKRRFIDHNCIHRRRIMPEAMIIE